MSLCTLCTVTLSLEDKLHCKFVHGSDELAAVVREPFLYSSIENLIQCCYFSVSQFCWPCGSFPNLESIFQKQSLGGGQLTQTQMGGSHRRDYSISCEMLLTHWSSSCRTRPCWPIEQEKSWNSCKYRSLRGSPSTDQSSNHLALVPGGQKQSSHRRLRDQGMAIQS